MNAHPKAQGQEIVYKVVRVTEENKLVSIGEQVQWEVGTKEASNRRLTR